MDLSQQLDELNTLQKQLSPNDAQYFDNLRFACNAPLFTNESAVNAILLDMLRDLVDAEHDGLDAQTFFGTDPQHLARQLRAQLPKLSFKKRFSLIATIVGITWLSPVANGGYSAEGTVIDLLNFLTLPVISLLAAFLLFRLFGSKLNARPWLMNLLAVGIILLAIAGFSLNLFWFPIQWPIMIPHPWNIIIIGGGLLILVGCWIGLLWHHRKSQTT